MRYVIAYDIEDNRRRTRLAKVLEGYGDRVQFSLFEAELSDDEVEVVLRRLRPLVDKDTDCLRVYPLCARCHGAVRAIGAPKDRPLDADGDGLAIV